MLLCSGGPPYWPGRSCTVCIFCCQLERHISCWSRADPGHRRRRI